MRLYQENPRYLEIGGRPRVVVGSGEHYGSLLNADFDYRPYFEALGRYGLNQTRVFSGTYRERPGHFGIVGNTLAPRAGRFVCPWLETAPNRFDLERPNPDYFSRLRDLLEHAARHDVIVELVLFCFWYGDDHWSASPMHPSNTVQGIGPEDRELVFTVRDNPLLAVQERFVRDVVREVNGFANLYFEVCNEPYSRHDGTAYLEWQHSIVDLIADTERSLPIRHLIAMNYQNRAHLISDMHPDVSIANFHYAHPEAVFANHHCGRVIADDETGFMGQRAEPYRKEAWRFLFSGGALFSHLDYGFTCDHPDGNARIAGDTPGYGGDDLRRQLVFLRELLEEHEAWRLQSANELFAQISNDLEGCALCDHGRLYLFYVPESSPGRTIALWLPPGEYTVSWINPAGCTYTHDDQLDVSGRFVRLTMPSWSGDLAFRIAPR